MTSLSKWCRWCRQPLRHAKGIEACPHCDTLACRLHPFRYCQVCADVMRVCPEPEWSDPA